MTKRQRLVRLDRDIGQARYDAYLLLDVDESLGEAIDAKLREAGVIIKTHLQRIDRCRR